MEFSIVIFCKIAIYSGYERDTRASKPLAVYSSSTFSVSIVLLSLYIFCPILPLSPSTLPLINQAIPNANSDSPSKIKVEQENNLNLDEIGIMTINTIME